MLYVVRTGGSGRIDGIPGSFLDGNTFMGLAFCMVAPLMILMARAETRPWLRRALYTLAFLTFVSIIFTYSRGAYVGLAAVLPLIFLRAKSKIVAMCLLIPTLLIAPLLLPDRAGQTVNHLETYQTDTSANQRLLAWSVAWNLAKDHPVTGAGFEFESSGNSARWLGYADPEHLWAFRYVSAAHSIYFQMLGQHGFVALGLFLWLLFGTLLSFQRTKRIADKNPEIAWMSVCASGLQIGLVGYMVSGAFLNSAYFDLAYLYIAMSAIFSRELRPYVKAAPKWQPYSNSMPSQGVAPATTHGGVARQDQTA
jgi:probable O-glycosylation ligase (exosortase A-associated)